MFDFIRANQMDIMLALCAMCMMMALLLGITRFLPRRRKWILIGMELVATFLLFFDRQAYLYSGNPSRIAFYMVRISNFMVFFLTSGIVFTFNLYLIDLLSNEGKVTNTPRRLIFTGVASILGMLLVVLSQFTGLYYYFDETNKYHRGPGFLICYLIPVVGPIVQYTVAFQHRRKFSKFINAALFLYIFVPIAVGILQIFTYGISIVNMSMVLVSISLYIFSYLDVNDEVLRVHRMEMENLQNDKKSMRRLFDQTATAFITAVEKKDDYSRGHSTRVASISRKIAEAAGKTEEECDEIYYAALLHDVGMIGLPDSVIGKDDDLTEEEYEIVKNKPVVSGEILSNITEYPYLSIAARYCNEKYDGSGYPEGLKGDEIPEMSRIIAIADAYAAMRSKKRYRDQLPKPIIREEFIRGGGIQFDPYYTDIMVRILDADANEYGQGERIPVEKEIRCDNYRGSITRGISIEDHVKKVNFDCLSTVATNEKDFSGPAIILFDSFDETVHKTEKGIAAYHYVEYGEVWFDGHYVSTTVRNMEVNVSDKSKADAEPYKDSEIKEEKYNITSYRYQDHIKVILESRSKIVEVVAALPDKSKSAYIGLTGENCYIKNITIEDTAEVVHEGEIPRIADDVYFTDRIESDIPNIQVDRTRSAYTKGIPVRDYLTIMFHSLSLPSSTLIWHCPYIVLYSSEDKEVGGKDYCEYAMVKLNGESDVPNEYATNKFVVEKTSDFTNWDDFRKACKAGIECEVQVSKKGNRVSIKSETLGIALENITTINDPPAEVYVALTGDQVALTDIRIR
ncbi:HD domain-containing phosphohydrolase [Butyrivibrio sp. WCD3002]|uniref:HD domain-containing phosphohydrolase n=1 Tax=Butyrivibrio sp. WCD3002 TaxID=1280676 RepID=UPI000414E36C|nr:HD domain-containing phosphohydrolase [Butyrivibrio sp. WCD3002]